MDKEFIEEMQFKISGLAIVQNDEKYVARMLQSIMPLVDEMIVLDGGSTDNTAVICKEEGALVVPRTFTGHYGDLRNEAIVLSKYPWILMLDADEYLDEDFVHLLPELVRDKRYDAYALARKNIIDGKEVGEGKDFQLRLFRRYCRWIYAVHEELVGFKAKRELDCGIIHSKDSEKYKVRNESYADISRVNIFDFPLKELKWIVLKYSK